MTPQMRTYIPTIELICTKEYSNVNWIADCDHLTDVNWHEWKEHIKGCSSIVTFFIFIFIIPFISIVHSSNFWAILASFLDHFWVFGRKMIRIIPKMK